MQIHVAIFEPNYFIYFRLYSSSGKTRNPKTDKFFRAVCGVSYNWFNFFCDLSCNRFNRHLLENIGIITKKSDQECLKWNLFTRFIREDIFTMMCYYQGLFWQRENLLKRV